MDGITIKDDADRIVATYHVGLSTKTVKAHIEIGQKEADGNIGISVSAVNAQPAVVALCKTVVDDQISETGNCQACSGETWNHYNDCYVAEAESLLRQIGGK